MSGDAAPPAKAILFEAKARKQFAALSPIIREQVMSKLDRYAATGAGDVKRLQGRPELRLRSGDFRIVFTDDGETISVSAVADRRDVYE